MNVKISQKYIFHMKFSEIYLHFLRLPWEIFFGVITED